MRIFVEEHKNIDGMDNVVATFNRGYSKLRVDGGAYLLYNGDNQTYHIFPEAIDVLKAIPKPEELERNMDASLKYLYVVKQEDELN